MFKMFKKTKRFISFVLSFVMVCALFTGITVYSADLTEDGYESTSILNKSLVLTSDDSSRTKDDGSYDGYIQTLESFDYDYLRITYTVSGNVTDDTKVFTFQPFDTSWGGWQDNFATISASTLKDGVYTFTIPVEKIKQSLTTGTIKGINISFCPEIGASVTLTGYYGLKTVNDTPTEDDGNSEESAKIEPIIIKTITEEDLANEDCNWFGSNKVETYVKVTDATVYSWLNAVVSLGTDRAGKASSKYLHASKCTVKSGGNYIQDGIVGKAGTGNYAFPKVNLNTATSSGTELSADEQKKITIDIKTGTANTNCELLGFKFSNGAVYPKGFKPPTCESASLDITEAAEKDKLKLSLDYCDKMNSSKYTSDSWANFQTALATAKEKYNNSSLSSEEYASARADLER